MSIVNDKLLPHYQRLNSRERVLFFAILLITLYGIWDSLLMAPQYARQKAIHGEIENIGQQLGSIDMQLQTVAQQLDGRAEASLKRRIADLRRQIASAADREQRMMSRFIPPQQMPRLLQDILRTKRDLRLLSLESLAVEPLASGHDETAADEAVPTAVYRHGVRIVFEGDFFAILDYLQAIEKLPWTLYWDEIDYAVSHYPRAEVTITVHTLSLNKEWIGV